MCACNTSCGCNGSASQDTPKASNCEVEQIKTAAAGAGAGLLIADILTTGGLGTLLFTGLGALFGWEAASNSGHCKR